jgi:prepilin-type N-terminal cleavage/methylation domain-containing protein
MRQRSGFSLLEALVAIAILGVALVPLLELQAQLARRAHAQAAIMAEASATQSALALLADLNPMARPQGAVETGSLRVTWRARPLSEPVRSTRAGQGEGAFIVRMYEVRATVTGGSDEPLAQFAFERVGWRSADRVVE